MCKAKANNIQIFRPHVSADGTDGWWCSFWQRERKTCHVCNQLAALSPQQHLSLYVSTFLHLTDPIYQLQAQHELQGCILCGACFVMTCVGETNGSSTVPIQPAEEKRSDVWPLIVWRGATDLVWGRTKGFLLVRFVSWLWADFLARIFCLSSKSWGISKWSLYDHQLIQFKASFVCLQILHFVRH